jgi:hypothetical protein
MKRRTILQVTAGGLAATVAGCNSNTNTGNHPSQTNNSSMTLPYRSDTDSDNVNDPRGLRLSNEDDTDHELSVQITTDEETIFKKTYDVAAESHITVVNVVAKRTTYTLEAQTDSGEETSFTWELSESVQDVFVDILGDGTLDVSKLMSEGSRQQADEPSEDDDVTLPYASENADENVEDPRGITLTNEDNTVREVEIEITEESDLILVKDYKLETNSTLIIPDLIAKKGVYPVAVKLEQTEESTSFDWEVSESQKRVEIQITADGKISVRRSGESK